MVSFSMVCLPFLEVAGSNPGQAAGHFFASRARVHSTSGFLLFSSKAIDGPVPNGLGDRPRQHVGRLGALSARALYPAAVAGEIGG